MTDKKVKKDKDEIYKNIKIPKYVYDLCDEDINKFCNRKKSPDLEKCMIKKFKKNKLGDKCKSAVISWQNNSEYVKKANKNMILFGDKLFPKIIKSKIMTKNIKYTKKQQGIVSKIYKYTNKLISYLGSIGIFINEKLNIFNSEDSNISWIFKLLLCSVVLLPIINFIPKHIIDNIFLIVNYIIELLVSQFGNAFLTIFKKISESFTVLVTSGVSKSLSIIKSLTWHFFWNPSQIIPGIFGFVVVILIILISILARID